MARRDFCGGTLQRYGMQIVKRCFHQHPGYDLDAAMREVGGKIEFDLDHMTGGKSAVGVTAQRPGCIHLPFGNRDVSCDDGLRRYARTWGGGVGLPNGRAVVAAALRCVVLFKKHSAGFGLGAGIGGCASSDKCADEKDDDGLADAISPGGRPPSIPTF